MSDIIIVALPMRDEPVWDVSSEKVPHVTLLYLDGEAAKDQTNSIVNFVTHAAKTMLDRFELDVDRRGTLGDDNADVLFFQDRWGGVQSLAKFREALLQHTPIKTAYDSRTQFPTWTPHLTLGYPDKPATEPDRSTFNKFTWIHFDRIAIWTGDYEGPEVELTYDHSLTEVSMSDINKTPAKALAHYGVKGMKWGHRRQGDGSVKVNPTKTAGGKAKVKVTGGQGADAHTDAIVARVGEQKLKKSGINSLSNKELQDLSTRLNLERNVKNLAPQPPAKKFLGNLLGNVGKQQATRIANDAAAKQVESILKNK